MRPSLGEQEKERLNGPERSSLGTRLQPYNATGQVRLRVVCVRQNRVVSIAATIVTTPRERRKSGRLLIEKSGNREIENRWNRRFSITNYKLPDYKSFR